MVSDSESEKRCYICNRNIDNVLSLFNIDNEKIPNHLKKMEERTYSLGMAYFDERKSRVYPYEYILDYDPMLFLLEKVKDESIREAIKNQHDSNSSLATFYIYADFEGRDRHNEKLISYIKKGGRIILNPEAVNIEFDYYLCPICNDRIESIYRYATV
ncbi:MAG: hypothetical protein OEZ52_08125 [Candidatus Aminicenantes bacterium]|nr:hypothetical protein [Candidatus Aminicenantes bacterium]